MSKLKLGNYTKIKTGKLDANASVENGKYHFFTCSNNTLRINDYAYDCECVLVAGNGDLNVKYYNGKFNAYQRTYIIESNEKKVLDTKYMYYLINSKIEQLRNNSIGGVIKYIKLNNLTDLEFEEINLNEQIEIVKKLDVIQELIEKRKGQLIDFELLIEDKFIDMFGNPNINEKNFIKVKLRECLINIDNGKSFVCENFARKGDYPGILKLSAVTYGYYNQDENKALINEEMYIPSVEAKKGDLLFTRKNTPELVGMSAYIYDTKPNLMLPDLIFRLNTTEKCNKVFLWKLINHKLFRKNITQISNGSAKSMSNISKERLMDLEIILPPIELQNEFEKFMENIQKQKEIVRHNLEEIEVLKNEVMNKYFD